MSVAIGSEVMTHSSLSGPTVRFLDADAASNQTNDMEGAGHTRIHRWWGGAGRGSSQLNGIIHTEVLQLNQLAFRHPGFDTDTDMSSQNLLSMSENWCPSNYEKAQHQYSHFCILIMDVVG